MRARPTVFGSAARCPRESVGLAAVLAPRRASASRFGRGRVGGGRSGLLNTRKMPAPPGCIAAGDQRQRTMAPAELVGAGSDAQEGREPVHAVARDPAQHRLVGGGPGVAAAAGATAGSSPVMRSVRSLSAS